MQKIKVRSWLPRVVLLLAFTLTGCDDTCGTRSCFFASTSTGGAGGGSGGGGGASVSAGVYAGSVDIVDVGSRSLEMVSDGSVIRGRIVPGNEVITLFLSSGNAFLEPDKGGQLSDGSRIASGPINELSSSGGTLSLVVPFSGQGQYRISLTRNAQRSGINAALDLIAGEYAAIDATGVSYTITISAADGGDFSAVDSDGCVYRLPTVFRDDTNVYSASGEFDPACETGGANFVDGATWNEQLTSALWIVSFRGETFALDISRR